MGLSQSPQFGGSSPFLWQDGKTTTLPLPPSAIGNTGSAVAINNRGDAVGIFFVANSDPPIVPRACAWIDGQCIDLGTLPGFTRCRVQDINDAREIVGYCQTNDNEFAPFIWRDGVMTDLRSLAQPTPVGTTLRYAYAINDSGQITGEGHDFLPVGDHLVAFLLTPALPENPGDVNCDAAVGVADLLQVIIHWNPSGPVGGRVADLNRDNRINHLDLLEVVANWG
jgi:probable HAF family extracellular repeat protein